jgi:hypothetical protein
MLNVVTRTVVYTYHSYSRPAPHDLPSIRPVHANYFRPQRTYPAISSTFPHQSHPQSYHSSQMAPGKPCYSISTIKQPLSLSIGALMDHFIRFSALLDFWALASAREAFTVVRRLGGRILFAAENTAVTSPSAVRYMENFISSHQNPKRSRAGWLQETLPR